MKKIKYILSFYKLLFLLTILLSCSENSGQKEENVGKTNAERQELLSAKIKFPEVEYTLSEEAKEATENWMHYTSMQSEIERMKDYTLADAMSNSTTILKVSDTLQRTVPKKLQETPIRGRLKVLYTKASVFNQLSEKQDPDLEELIKVVEEIPIDFYNLNIQLNEVFIETPEFD